MRPLDKQGTAGFSSNMYASNEGVQGAHYEEAEQGEALGLLLQAATQGNARAKVAVATIYATTKVIAELGDADAQYTLGLLYANGQGVPEDVAQALEWYRKAADQGNPQGEVAVGAMYLRGTGVPPDDAQAMAWFRKAADQGSAVARMALGQMYMDGAGVPQDYVQAHMWLNLAAAALPAWDTNARDTVVRARDLLAFRMTAAQVAEAQKLAREWKPK